MPDESPAFDLVCRLLGERTDLTVSQVRGTVRLALQEAGLFDSVVTHAEMAVVARRLLAQELAAGGVPDAEALCASLADRIATVPDERVEDTPDAVFARLGLAS
ncbi:MAG TPA: hypothetical protein VKB65_01790 [Myxococcota bacterium]|nr:hypothetical protein [Myxococcota bacterium]